MKRWFTLLGVCLVAISMVMAADQPLKKFMSVDWVQAHSGVLNETTPQFLSLVPDIAGNNQESGVAEELPIICKEPRSMQNDIPVKAVSGKELKRLKRLAKQSAERAVKTASTWLDEGNYDISWISTPAEEYCLQTPEQLAGLAYLIASGSTLQNITVRLGADMDMSAHKWVPAGTIQVPFMGVFDGRGYTISGLNVADREYAGLFGYAMNAEIRNVMFASDCRINGDIAGSIAGRIESGIVENCCSEAVISGVYTGGFAGEGDASFFRLCVFNGSVEKEKESGRWYGTFLGTAVNELTTGENSCSVQMTISPVENYPDSVFIQFKGYRSTTVQFGGKIREDGLLHIPSGQYMGTMDTWALFLYGIEGSTLLLDCEFIGTLSDDGQTLIISITKGDSFGIVRTEDWENIYAFEWLQLPFSLQKEIGRVGTLTSSGGYGFKDCYYRDDCATEAEQTDGTAKTAAEMQSQVLVDALNEGVTEAAEANARVLLNLWTLGNSGPVLEESGNLNISWWSEGNYDTSWYDANQDDFVLTTPAQLAGLSRLVADGVSFQYNTIRLGADIDLSAHQWIPIGYIDAGKNCPFIGLFDGGGHIISGLRMAQESYAGLFGVVQSSDIRNLILSSSCDVNGTVAGSIAGQMTNSVIMNCRSDATVCGVTAGGLVGKSVNSSLVASFFNGQLNRFAENAWEGDYQALVSSSMAIDGETIVNVTVKAKRGTIDGYTIVLAQPSSYNTYTLNGCLGSDGELHIPMGQQVVAKSDKTTYSTIIESELEREGELVVSLSGDKNQIDFRSTTFSGLIMVLYEDNQLLGYQNRFSLPFSATRQDAESFIGGLVGEDDETFIENSYYRQGCLPDGFADTDRVLAQDDLLSASFVTSLNTSVTEIVSSDPFVASLNRWQMGTNGPELSQEKEVATNWWTSEGNYDISWYDESQYEFTLSTPAQLAGLAYLVNTCHEFIGTTVTLANDIDLAGHLWVPIGRNSRKVKSTAIFYGFFDGGGHTIHNMTINTKAYTYAQGASSVLSGLFGYNNREMRNITLAEDCSVLSVATGSQYLYVGGVCGLFGGEQMDNCHNEAQVEVQSLYSDVFAAGILGFDNSYKPVYNSSNIGKIEAESDFGEVFASGLVATNARVQNGYNVGDISGKGSTVYVGGIAARYGQLTNVYHSGSLVAIGVSENPEVQPQVTVSPLSDNSGSSVEYGYYDVACVADTTGLNAKGVGMQAAEMKTTDFAAMLTENATTLMSNDPELPTLLSWEIQAGQNNGYPVFGEGIEAGAWWTSEGNYDTSWYDESLSEFELSTPAQLAGLAYLVKTGNTFDGKTVSLTCNIDLDGLKWEPIGVSAASFNGSFNGGGYEIHNLHCEIVSADLAIAGLFGNVRQATLSNIVLADDCFVKGSGAAYVGGIVAYAYKSVINSCISHATINFDGPIGYAGGIAGYISNSIVRACENYGAITANVINTGVYMYYYTRAAGLVGAAYGSTDNGVQEISLILNNSNHADVTVHGDPDYESYAGGTVGYIESPVVVWNNYNTANITLDGIGYAGGISGDIINDSFEMKNCYNVGFVSTTAGSAYPIAPSRYGVVNNLFYLSTCVAEAGGYMGTALSAEEMKSEAFAALLNDEVKAHNAMYDNVYGCLFWKVDAQFNDGYPVFTDQDPGYTAVESVKADVRIYPTAVSGILYVNGAETAIYVYDLAGHIVSVTEAVEGTTMIDMSGLTKGIYLVRTGDRVERVVKL